MKQGIKISEKDYKRIITIGDIHGCFPLLKKLMGGIKFNGKEDLVIFLGDYIDRGKDSYKVIQYLIKLRSKYPDNVILLKGNHEELAYNFYTAKKETKKYRHKYWWFMNGGADTVNSFGGDIDITGKLIVPFFRSLYDYAESENHVFVHGGIPVNKTLEETKRHELLWNRDLINLREERTIVVGHTYNYKDVTRYGKNFLMMDTGCVYGGNLSAYDILNDTVYSIENPIKPQYTWETEEETPIDEKYQLTHEELDREMNDSMYNDDFEEVNKTILAEQSKSGFFTSAWEKVKEKFMVVYGD